MPGKRLKVLMLGTFPEASAPDRGVFNLRALKQIAEVADVIPIQARTLRPGRAAISTYSYEGVEFVRLGVPLLPGNYTWGIRLAAKLSQRNLQPLLQQSDVLHTINAAVAGVLGSWWTAGTRVAHVAQVIGSDINGILPETRSKWGVRGWERHLDGVSCNSRALHGAFQALYPGVPNVRTIYRGVDLARFSPAPSFPVHTSFLFLGGLPQYPKVYVHGENTKGGRTLMEAWRIGEERLHAAGAKLRFAGPNSDGDVARAWRADLRYPDSVELVGVLSGQELVQAIQSSAAVLLPSMEEGLPNVAMEASACARAVIGSDVGGVGEVVEHGVTGELLPPGDANALADALVRLAREPAHLVELGRSARNRMEEQFDMRAFPAKIMDLYEAALAHRSR